MDLRFSMTPTGSPVSVNFPSDFKVDLAFVDSNTGEVLHDFTGDKALLVSAMIAETPAEVIQEFLRGFVVDLARLTKGIS